MPCLVALIIFSILGIFSASHRKLAREAFDCVFRRVTLRPCDTGFHLKVKAKVLGPILPRFPKLARLISLHFEKLAWVFMVLMTVSTFYTFKGVYNFWAWGDCNGQFATGGFCAFDPTGDNSKITGQDGAECKDVGLASRNLSIEGVDTTIFPVINTDEAAELFFVGCYACDYTRKTYPRIKEVLKSNQARFRFGHYVTKVETLYILPYDVCVNQLKPERFFDYIDRLFFASLEEIADEQFVKHITSDLGIEDVELQQCLGSTATRSVVQKQQNELAKTGIYGTPTIFINGEPVVGPKPMRVYERLIRGWWL
jgi:hypothetical protein